MRAMRLPGSSPLTARGADITDLRTVEHGPDAPLPLPAPVDLSVLGGIPAHWATLTREQQGTIARALIEIRYQLGVVRSARGAW